MAIETAMHEGMEGPHLFIITIKSNDPTAPEKQVQLKGDFGKY